VKQPPPQVTNDEDTNAMKTGNDANEVRKTANNRPYAMLGAGRLTSAVWKEGDDDSGWHYRFNIFRMNRPSGRVSQRYRPQDVVDLARLAQVLAFALSDDGCMDSELRDDLSCLAACLDQVLPDTKGGRRPRPRPWGAVGRAVREVLDYLLEDERVHFAESPSTDHIYRQLVLLDRWCAGVEEVESVRLDRIGTEVQVSSDGGCPLCAETHELVVDQRLVWAACRSHRTRWCLGERDETEGPRSVSPGWHEVRDYLGVEPLRPKRQRTERNR
jgi:hypothetical protein